LNDIEQHESFARQISGSSDTWSSGISRYFRVIFVFKRAISASIDGVPRAARARPGAGKGKSQFFAGRNPIHLKT